MANMDIADSLFYNKVIKKISGKRSNILSNEHTPQSKSLFRETSARSLSGQPILSLSKPQNIVDAFNELKS